MRKNFIIILLMVLFVTGCAFTKKDISSDKTEKVENTEKISTEETNEDSSYKEEITTTTSTTTVPVTTSQTTTTKKTSESVTTSKKTTTTQTTKKASSTTKKTTTTATIQKPSSTTVATTTTTNSTTTTTQKQLTESEVYNAIIALKSKYPTGTPWDNDNCVTWKGGIYTKGCGCAGFAFMLSDAAFGSRKAEKHTNFDNIKVGDIVRINGDTHSVIVLKINGNNYTVAEGNMEIVGLYDGAVVYWGRTITLSEFKETGTYVLTRW